MSQLEQSIKVKRVPIATTELGVHRVGLGAGPAEVGGLELDLEEGTRVRFRSRISCRIE